MKNLIFALLIISLASCETAISPKLPRDGNGLVVYSFFRPDAPITIDIFETTPILSAESPQRSTGLIIDLFENNNLIESIGVNAQGNYISQLIPSVDKTYRFEFDRSGKTFSASNHVPAKVLINEVKLTRIIQNINFGEYGYPATLSFSDPANQANFYAIEVWVQSCEQGCDETAVSGQLNELLVEDIKVETSGNVDINLGAGPEGIDGIPYFYFTDNGFDGETFEVDLFLIPTILDFEIPQNVTIKFVLKSISTDYYDYLITSDYQQQIEEEEGFSEPVQISSNIQNGLGVFASYNYDIYSVRIND
ncbi:MAG: DUF4249 domain-containing protein [Cyclobacteriaceae bacterium]